MGYKTRRSIIQGSKYHKDLELAYGLDGSAMPDGRPKHSAFQLKGDLNKDNKLSGYEANRQAAIDKAMAERDDTPMDRYGPYRSEHVKTDTPMNFLGKIKNANAGELAKGLLGPAGMFMKTETPMSKVLDEVKVVGEKKDNLVDVTEEYKTKGNKSTRDHIAKGGKVFRAADGSLTLRSNA